MPIVYKATRIMNRKFIGTSKCMNIKTDRAVDEAEKMSCFLGVKLSIIFLILE